MKIKLYALLLLPALLLMSTACGSKIDLNPETSSVKGSKGIYHSFWRKHNLWLVAEAYGKSVKELVIANKLKTPLDIQTGEKIFIPGVSKHKKVEYKDPRWNVMLKSMIWPLEGKIIREWRNSDDQPEEFDGIDIHAPEGSLIRAARDGWVVYQGDDFPAFGKMIIIQHRYVLASIYACNSENLVKVGMRVDEGEPVAKVGRCRGYELPSLHFEVVQYNKRVNPHKAFEVSYEEMRK